MQLKGSPEQIKRSVERAYDNEFGGLAAASSQCNAVQQMIEAPKLMDDLDCLIKTLFEISDCTFRIKERMFGIVPEAQGTEQVEYPDSIEFRIRHASALSGSIGRDLEAIKRRL